MAKLTEAQKAAILHDLDEQEAAYAKTWQGQIDVAAEKFRELGRAILEAFKLR